MELNESNQLPKWYYGEMKGPTDDDCNEADQISAMSFDSTGKFLATGDRGGRIVIFKANKDSLDNTRYDVYGTFTSHEAGFDYLKSVEIEEKINKIEWLPQINDSRCLLTTNDKVIKLWRVKEKSNRPLMDFTDRSILRQSDSHFLYGKRIESSCRKTFANAHAFNINSLSVNSDQETFLSCDELRINVWHLQHTDQSFNIVDLKPANMENLTEVITCAKFHPHNCATFVYSLSKGVVRLCDMRQRALCDEASMHFVDDGDTDGSAGGKSFFSEIISSISDIQISNSGLMLMARDYLNVKIWDLRNTKKTLQTLPVHDHFRAKLCGLYENDCIFDKFECSFSPDDKYLVTGSYNNFVRQFNIASGVSETLQIHRSMAMTPSQPLNNKIVTSRSSTAVSRDDVNEVCLDSIDLSKKLLHLQWHPRLPLLALATTHNLYFLQNHTGGELVGSQALSANQCDDQSLQLASLSFDSNPQAVISEAQLNGFAHCQPRTTPVHMEVDEV